MMENSAVIAALTSRENRAIVLVFCCTLIGAAAQMFIKTGASRMPDPSVVQMISSLPLMFGYCLYGISTLLLVMALKRGDLSILYPVIALTYVWVCMLSVFIFNETLNPLKAVGLVVIVTGVAILGKGSRK